jgi:hypothetical protein
MLKNNKSAITTDVFCEVCSSSCKQDDETGFYDYSTIVNVNKASRHFCAICMEKINEFIDEINLEDYQL